MSWIKFQLKIHVLSTIAWPVKSQPILNQLQYVLRTLCYSQWLQVLICVVFTFIFFSGHVHVNTELMVFFILLCIHVVYFMVVHFLVAVDSAVSIQLKKFWPRLVPPSTNPLAFYSRTYHLKLLTIYAWNESTPPCLTELITPIPT